MAEPRPTLPAAHVDPPDGRLGLYVHVPFCEVKCTYCHFAIDPRRPDAPREDRYVRAVAAEIGGAEPRRADTLYFGGGTPSLLGVENLARLIAAARARFLLPPDTEITLEANPRDLDARGLEAVRAAGVTRLSLGVQSFDDPVLRQMGRLHSAADARQAFAWARAAGFASVSLDLILGWEGETPARWEDNLRHVRALSPDHVSLYVLEVEGRTALDHRARHGLVALPDDDVVADLFRRTVESLGEAGLERYEISNFGRPGHASRHNTKYWEDVPFLGFGMAAHSYREGVRWWNHETFVSYCAAVESGGPPAARAGERVLDLRDRATEALFTGLRRREGIDLDAFRRRYGLDPLREYEAAFRDAQDAGIAELSGGWLRLTESGVLVSSELFQALVA